MMHDENIYPDPFTFNPGRFLKDGKLDPAILQPESVVFGFGRRIWYVYQITFRECHFTDN